MTRIHFQITAVIACIVIAISCAGYISAPHDTRLAKVNTYKNISVFIESAPISEYEQLGTVYMNTDSVTTDLAFNQVKKLMLQAAKNFPTAQGIIVTDLNFHEATVIKFK